MTIKSTILGALTPVLANTWAVELPPNPTWPAIMFEIDTTPETQWVLGGGYDQHDVTVVIFDRSLANVEALTSSVLTAVEAVTGFIADEDRGDAEYESDPEVFGYFINFRIRTARD